jgi:hypothetical protein
MPIRRLKNSIRNETITQIIERFLVLIMPVKYQNVWNTMNELETVTSKICSAREILDCAIDAHQEHKHEKVEHLLNAVDEFLQYYLAEFDEKFKDAWKCRDL